MTTQQKTRFKHTHHHAAADSRCLSDNASCPECNGGWCSKEVGHSGPHHCGSCGHEWY